MWCVVKKKKKKKNFGARSAPKYRVFGAARRKFFRGVQFFFETGGDVPT